MNLDDYPHAVAGDVIFVSGAKKGPVEFFQRRKKMPHPEKGHVACVVSPVDIVEAMIGEDTYSLVFSEWLATRADGDQFFVLRHPNAAIEQTDKVIDAALFYLEESYALEDALRNSPEREGRSICSVTAAKILRKSELVEPDCFSRNEQVYPGPLYQMLLDLGWREIAPGDAYFENRVISEAESPMAMRTKTKKSVDLMRAMTSKTDEFIATMDGLLGSMPKDDIFFALSANEVNRPLDLIATQIADIAVNHCRALKRIESGIENWRDRSVIRVQLDQLRARTDRKEKLAFDLLTDLLRRTKQSLNDAGFVDASCQAADAMKQGAIPSKNVTKTLVDSYLQAELTFLASTGQLAHEFELPQITFPQDQIDALSEEHQNTVRSMHESLVRYYNSVGTAIQAHATQIGNARSVVEGVVGSEAIEKLDRLVREQMKELLFGDLRRTPEYQAAIELRSSINQA